MSDSTRLIVFIGVLVTMSLLEALFPKRARTQKRSNRWLTNGIIIIINAMVLRLITPISAIYAADFALDNHWGLLANSPIPLPFWLECILGFILLDLAIYLQHVASHKFNVLWRIHKVHHADRDIDASTGIRFHPIEVALSMLYKCIVILILGPLTVAVFIFEITLNASAIFNHANIRLPKFLDKTLRTLIVTPDTHRVHHSVIARETNSNYGFFLITWDKLFKTYTAQPQKGHLAMTIGLSEYQTQQPSSVVWALRAPFSKNETHSHAGVSGNE